jgi:hypothetical protein
MCRWYKRKEFTASLDGQFFIKKGGIMLESLKQCWRKQQEIEQGRENLRTDYPPVRKIFEELLEDEKWEVHEYNILDILDRWRELFKTDISRDLYQTRSRRITVPVNSNFKVDVDIFTRNVPSLLVGRRPKEELKDETIYVEASVSGAPDVPMSDTALYPLSFLDDPDYADGMRESIIELGELPDILVSLVGGHGEGIMSG